MKIAVVDNNNLYQELIKNRIYKYSKKAKINVDISSFNNGSEIINEFKSGNNFDAVFLEYSLPDINGYEIGHKLRKLNNNFKLIYITTNLESVYKCIKNNIFRYISKNELDEELEECANSLFKLKKENTTYVVDTHKGFKNINFSELMYFDFISLHKKVKLVTSENTYNIKTPSLKETFEFFDDNRLVYICKGTIINIENISSLNSNQIEMNNGDKLYISRRKLNTVKEQYINFNSVS